MKTVAIIVLSIVSMASLLINMWFYTETSNLDDSVSRQLGRGYSTTYELPTDTISRLKSNFTQLISANQRLEIENQQYEATLAQIQREAEEAQRMGIFGTLFNLIFSLY